MVVSNIFYFHPYLGKWSNLTNIFQLGWNHQLDMLKAMALSHSFVHARCEYQSVWYYGIIVTAILGILNGSWLEWFAGECCWRSFPQKIHKNPISFRKSYNSTCKYILIIYLNIQWYEISNADFLPTFKMFVETLLRLAEWRGTHYLGFLQCIQLNEVRSCFRFGQIFVAHTNLLSNPWVIIYMPQPMGQGCENQWLDKWL